MTAQRVAAHRLTFDRMAAPYGDPAADERLSRDVAGGSTTGSAQRMAAYLAARTTFFDRAVVTALDRGVTQVVVAAAGYDGRAWRYAKPGVRWFEVDHPDTQRDKQARLHRLGIDSDQVTFVSAISSSIRSDHGWPPPASTRPGPRSCCARVSPPTSTRRF